MNSNLALPLINATFPMVGIGVMLYYRLCDTSCSYLQGTFAGVELPAIGILFMAILIVLTMPLVNHYHNMVTHLRTVMMSCAVGADILLVRFQMVNNTYCPFCLMFGLCVLVLFAANFLQMNRWLAAGSFVAGIIAFALLFDGSVLPLY